MKILRKRGTASNTFRFKILDSSKTDGSGLTGLTSSSSGLIISTIADNEAAATTYTAAGSTIESITTLGTFAAPTATKIRFKEVDATNHKGLYEIQIADARMAVASSKTLVISISGATNCAETDLEIQLTQLDLDSSTDGGLSTLTGNVPQTGDSYARIGANGVGLTSVAIADNGIGTGSFAAGATIPRCTLVDTVTLTSTLTTYTGNTPQTGDAYAVVNDTNFGNAKLVRSTTPANTLNVSATGEADANITKVNGVAATTAGTVDSNVTKWSGTNVAAVDTAGYPKVTVKSGTGAGEVSLTAGLVTLASVTHTGAVIPTVSTVTDKAGYALSTASYDAAADALLDRTNGIETGYTPRQAWRLGLSADTGKVSGAATTTIKIRDRNDTKDRITSTVDSSGNRTAVTVDVT